MRTNEINEECKNKLIEHTKSKDEIECKLLREKIDLKIEIENLKDDALKLRMHERYYRSGK